MAALDTVGKIVDYSRILLQDTLEPFRYPTDQLIGILNLSIQDAKRLRPDLFLSSPVDLPLYSLASDTIAVDPQYRMALVYFVVGQAQLRDEEDTQDTRASVMLIKFAQMLTEPLMAPYTAVTR